MNGNRRYTKIKRHPEKGVYLEYQELRQDSGMWDDCTLRTDDLATPEIEEAFQALVPHVLSMCEIPGSNEHPLEVRGVSLSYGDEQDGVTLTALRTLMLSASPLVLNTPHAPLGADKVLLRRLGDMFNAADEFLAGHRNQTDLFQPEAAEAT